MTTLTADQLRDTDELINYARDFPEESVKRLLAHIAAIEKERDGYRTVFQAVVSRYNLWLIDKQKVTP